MTNEQYQQFQQYPQFQHPYQYSQHVDSQQLYQTSQQQQQQQQQQHQQQEQGQQPKKRKRNEKEKEKKKRQKKDKDKQSYENQISSLRQQIQKQNEILEEYRKAFQQKESERNLNLNPTFSSNIPVNEMEISERSDQSNNSLQQLNSLSTPQESQNDLNTDQISINLTENNLALSPSTGSKRKNSKNSKKDKKMKREMPAQGSEIIDIQQRIVQNFLNLIEELPKCSPVRRPLIKIMSRDISLSEMRKILWISDRTWSRIQSEDEKESVIYLKYAMDSTRERVSEEVMNNVKRILDQILPLSPGKPFRKQARTNQQIYDQYLEECAKERIISVSFSTFYRHMKTLSIHREKPTST